jgi:hypothetical protein
LPFFFQKLRYLYEVARRHAYFYGPELLYYAEKYKDILTECCQAADKDACLIPKVIFKRRIRQPVHKATSDFEVL